MSGWSSRANCERPDFLEEAEAVLRAVLAANPRHVEALIERAFLSRRRGDRASALALFLRASRKIRAMFALGGAVGRASVRGRAGGGGGGS